MRTTPGQADACARCGLVHEPEELFVAIGEELVVETCRLQNAFEAAHSWPLPPGSSAYHATHPSTLNLLLKEVLDPNRARSACKHVALAETPGIAAGVLLPLVDGVPMLAEGLASHVVLAVDVSGLHLFFELGEARHHGAQIDPIRIKVLDPQPGVDMTGWSDPAWRHNHSDCIALRGHPLARQLLNAVYEEFARRYPYDAVDDERFRQIVDTLTRNPA